MRVSKGSLEAVNVRLAGQSPLDIMKWAHGTFGRRAAILSSMQRGGSILCHLADRAGLELDVVFVDTGVLHQETLRTRDELARTHPHLRVITLTAEQSFEAQTRELGVLYLSKEGQERCCHLRKSAPLHVIRGRYDAFVSALRRGEGGARKRIGIVELDDEMNALRVHPFAEAADDAFEIYHRAHRDVVMNPLHGMGFPSIGCFPCTTPVLPDEPERAGRWRHLANVQYCGINPTDRARIAEPAIDLDDGYRTALGIS